jgi:bifunctional non-homologous end joining protein LigD
MLTETVGSSRGTAIPTKDSCVVFDGELVCLDEFGRSKFYDLMFRRGEPFFYAFDLLWHDGEDLRPLPLIERKKRLRRLIRSQKWPLLYLDYIAENGSGLFEHSRPLDLEGIIAKRKDSHYHVTEKGSPNWIKIKNPAYSQAECRQELFERSPQ